MDAMSETQWIEKKLSEKTGTIVKLSPRQEGENTVFWNGNPYMVSFNGEKAQKRECALVQYILAGFEEGAPQEKKRELEEYSARRKLFGDFSVHDALPYPRRRVLRP